MHAAEARLGSARAACFLYPRLHGAGVMAAAASSCQARTPSSGESPSLSFSESPLSLLGAGGLQGASPASECREGQVTEAWPIRARLSPRLQGLAHR